MPVMSARRDIGGKAIGVLRRRAATVGDRILHPMHHAFVSGLRRLGGTPPLLSVTALILRGRCVRESAAFVAREILGRRALVVYRLRGSGLRVALRHRTGDVVTLGEVWRNHDYDPPAPVRAVLAGGPDRIMDLGGNVGMFALHAFGQWPAARVSSYEPDPANAAVLERSVAANALADRWTLVTAAAGAAPGTVRFAAGQDALSHAVEDGDGAGAGEVRDAITVPVEDVLPQMAGADLVKIDIEGGEWAILDDPRFAQAPPRIVVLEYHPRGCPGPDPHAAVRAAMDAAGLTHADIWRRDDGHGMLWAWRT
jgi:FkbM family methyltransferase